jgi:hypothetical protein
MATKTAPKMPKQTIEKAGNRSLAEIIEIVRSVEKELKEKPELAEKLFPKPHERVF